jgi:hypothetical protein
MKILAKSPKTCVAMMTTAAIPKGGVQTNLRH